MPDQKLTQQLMDNPAVKDLIGQLGEFVVARATDAVGKQAGKMTGAAAGAASDMAESVASGDNPAQTMGKGLLGAIKGKLGIGASKRPTNITDEFFIGLPVDQVYSAWCDWEGFPGFMKGVEKVDQDEDGVTSNWTAKIFLNRRSWKATVVEDVENERIKWKTEGAKGTIDGTITFHSLGDRLTMLMYVLEYRPKGFFEWWGNRWRAVGRRARLDVKHFKRHVMMNSEEYAEDEDEGEEDSS